MLNKEAYLVRKFYNEKTVKELDEAFEKAAQGGAREKYEFAFKMNDLNSLYFAPSNIEIYRQALEIFEEAAGEGSVEAMEMAILYYARGIANAKTETTHERGSVYMTETPRPDFYKAKEWAVKAVTAGSAWAANVLPRLEADIARVEAEKPTNGGSGPSPS